MPPKRRRRFQGLYYHSSPPKVLPMNGQLATNSGQRPRGSDVKLSTIRIWMHEKDIGKLTRVLWAGQGNRLRQQASTNAKVKRFLSAVPYVMNSIKDVHQAVIDNNLENLQTNLEPPVPPALVTCRDANGLNLIHKAAGLGHATILEYLITTWPDGVHESDITGKTPLHWAASAKNNMRCYTLLTQAGCDEEAFDYKMKTPSFYRHKPHEIERAFLTYVPEAPRVSPDVATDWEALCVEGGDGKKPDIKIPDLNGFGRHSNAESNENTSEAENAEAGHEDEDVGQEHNEPITNEDQQDEEAEEDVSEKNNDIDGTKELTSHEYENQNEEDAEAEQETHDEDDDGVAEKSEDQEMLEEAQDDKQQTQFLIKTTENLINGSEDEDKIAKENMENIEQDNGKEKDNQKTEDENLEDIREETVLQASEESVIEEPEEGEKNHTKNYEKITDQEIGQKARETLENEEAVDGNCEAVANEEAIELDKDSIGLNKKDSNNEDKAEAENKAQDEEQSSDITETVMEKKPESPLQAGQDCQKEGLEEISQTASETDETPEEQHDINQENVSKANEDTLEEDEENIKVNGEEEDKSESKTLMETLSGIKNEVKDNVLFLKNQIKNVFTDKDNEEEPEQYDEKSSTKMGENIELNKSINGKEIGNSDDNKEENQAAPTHETPDAEHQEDAKEFMESSNVNQNKLQNDNVNDHEANGKGEEATQENDSTLPDRPTTGDAEKRNMSNLKRTPESLNQTESIERRTSSSNSHSSIEDTPSNIQTPHPTTPQPKTKDSPKQTTDKTEEDENNNNSKLVNELVTTAETVNSTNLAESVTDEQLRELDRSLEAYKNAEENANLEEMNENLKDHVKEIAMKETSTISKVNNSKGDYEKLETDSNDVIIHTENSKEEMPDKTSIKKSESSDEEDEAEDLEQRKVNECPAELGNEGSSETEDEVVIENDPEPEEGPSSETFTEAHEGQVPKQKDTSQDEDKCDDAVKDDEASPTPSLAIEGFVQGAAEDNTVQSQTAAYVDDDEEVRLQSIIQAGDMEQLAQIVLNGDGHKLLNVEAKEPEIQAFLTNVPNYMEKIRSVHEAARQGSLLNLQQALDRRKFAIARDDISPNGATPLHVAVLFGNSDIVRYLAARFPETTAIADNEGRTALHYAAVINDNGHFYNILLQLGASTKMADKLGHTAEDYLGNEELADTLNYKQLLKPFGAEGLEAELLNDQGHIENQSIQENPLFKTEQGKYLADNLADPLIKALTHVAQKRPSDPLQYLANYLQNFVASRNENGRSITQAAVHSSSSKTDTTGLASAQQSTPPDTQTQRQTALINGNIHNNTTVSNTDHCVQKFEELDNFEDDGSDSDAAMSKKLEERDEHGQSILHFTCARSQRKSALLRVIVESKVDITYRDELYRTARDVALQAKQPANAKEIDNYVMSLAIVGDVKPFEHFAISGYDHIIDVVDESDTPITQAVEARGLHELAEYLKTIRPLEELREELHQMIRDSNMERVMEIADSENGKWLIKAKNYYGRTALHIAVLYESEEIVEHFVNRCPEALKIGDNLERTPLHYAMGINIVEVISRILIKNGAKRTYKDLKGRQPSYYFMNKADILRMQEEEDENR